jgi:HEPN domain-containing protein
MASKKQRLEDCTKAELKSLAHEYDIKYEPSWKKGDYIRVLSRSRKFNLNGINEILAKVSSAGSVKEAVRSAKHDFFDDTAGRVFKQNDELAIKIAEAFSIAEIVDDGYIDDVDTKSILLRNSKINKLQVPNHIKNQWSDKQWKAFGAARKTTYYVPRLIDAASSLASQSALIVKYKSIFDRQLPERVEYYVSQAYRSYVAKCYDGCIVMLSRAIEYSLKEVLKSKSTIPLRATLGELIDMYRKACGDNKIIEKILEVQNMERVICAHDKPPYEKIMQCEDADHAWTAVDLIFRDFLNVQPLSVQRR